MRKKNGASWLRNTASTVYARLGGLYWYLRSTIQEAWCDRLNRRLQETRGDLELHRRLGVHAHADLLAEKLAVTTRCLEQQKRRLAFCTSKRDQLFDS